MSKSKKQIKIKNMKYDFDKKLSKEEFHVLREKGTEKPFTGKYYLHFEKGNYYCKACDEKLFESNMKFESSCGWPSFDDEVPGDKIKKLNDKSHGMTRIELQCKKCNSHLGHLFNDGPTITGLRYCVNSLSLNFKK